MTESKEKKQLEMALHSGTWVKLKKIWLVKKTWTGRRTLSTRHIKNENKNQTRYHELGLGQGLVEENNAKSPDLGEWVEKYTSIEENITKIVYGGFWIFSFLSLKLSLCKYFLY